MVKRELSKVRVNKNSFSVKRFTLIFIFLFLLNLNFISASFGYGTADDSIAGSSFGFDTSAGGLTKEIIRTFNVNSSNFWDSLNSPNLTQMENNAEELNIKESWLTSFGNNLWCALTGCSMQGNIDMNENNITKLDALEFKDGSQIKVQTNDIFQGMDNAIVILSNQTIGAGQLTHCLLDNQGQKVISCWQSGLNGSGQYTRNSGLYFPDFGFTNGTFLTDINLMWQHLGIQPKLSYFSDINETSLAVQFGIETQRLILHNDLGNGLLESEGDNNFFLNGNIFDVVGRTHIRQERLQAVGFSAGAKVDLINENFEDGNILPFVLTTSSGDPNEWEAVSSPDCFSNICATSSRISGGGGTNSIMQVNFSTETFNNVNLTFRLNTTDFDGPDKDVFNVTINNNSGSGNIQLFVVEDGIDVNALIDINMPAGMDNQTLISLEFHCRVDNNDEFCRVDNIIFSGNATIDTTANVTVTDSIIDFGIQESGDGIRYTGSQASGMSVLNITADEINLIGNVTQTIVNQQTLNITDSLNVVNNGTFGDTVITKNLIVNNSALFVNSLNDNVGIGTNSPGEKLEVVGTIKTDSLKVKTISTSDSSVDIILSGAETFNIVDGVIQVLGIDASGDTFVQSIETGSTNGLIVPATNTCAFTRSGDPDFGLCINITGNKYEFRANGEVMAWIQTIPGQGDMRAGRNLLAGGNIIAGSAIQSGTFFRALSSARALEIANNAYAFVLTSAVTTGMFFNNIEGNIELHNSGVTKFAFDMVNGYLGIGTRFPTHELNVVGDANITGNLFVGKNLSINGAVNITGGYNISGGLICRSSDEFGCAWASNATCRVFFSPGGNGLNNCD